MFYIDNQIELFATKKHQKDADIEEKYNVIRDEMFIIDIQKKIPGIEDKEILDVLHKYDYDYKLTK